MTDNPGYWEHEHDDPIEEQIGNDLLDLELADHLPYRDGDGVWCCETHEQRHGDEVGW